MQHHRFALRVLDSALLRSFGQDHDVFVAAEKAQQFDNSNGRVLLRRWIDDDPISNRIRLVFFPTQEPELAQGCFREAVLRSTAACLLHHTDRLLDLAGLEVGDREIVPGRNAIRNALEQICQRELGRRPCRPYRPAWRELVWRAALNCTAASCQDGVDVRHSFAASDRELFVLSVLWPRQHPFIG